MATVFLSYQHNDEALARGLELRLENKQHNFRIKVGDRPPGDYRMVFANALEASDAVVFLLSGNGLSSQHVLVQLGSAKVFVKTQRMLILPVVVGTLDIPDVVSEIMCYELPAETEKELDRLADQLDRAIRGYLSTTPIAPSVFVSHKHKDEQIASALVTLLESAFEVQKRDIRCTSVRPYTISPGENFSERLRTDVAGAQLVIGLIGPETAESMFVLFELGASWGRDVPTFPLLVRGASPKDVPGPLSQRHSVSLEDPSNCVELVDEIAAATTLKRIAGIGVERRVREAAENLAKVAKGDNRKTSAGAEPRRPARRPVPPKKK